MKKLTEAELSEPLVEYIVPDGTPLPEEITKTLELYIGKRVTNGRTNGTKYNIPAYLMREWLAKYSHVLNGGD
jgi:hypothetical protein